jgi:hypothetical protein
MYSPGETFSLLKGDCKMSKFSLDRRRFALGAAAAAAAAIVHPGEVLVHAQQPATPGSLQERAEKALAQLTPSARAEVETKLGNLLRKYGSRLSDEQKTDIHRILAETQDGLEKMRAFALDNSDQPATVFLPYRKESRS